MMQQNKQKFAGSAGISSDAYFGKESADDQQGFGGGQSSSNYDRQTDIKGKYKIKERKT